MLYERAACQLLTLYVCPVENVLGPVPLIPCYLRGDIHMPIQYSLQTDVPDGAGGHSKPDSGTGSLLFEVNIWIWKYGRT